MAVTTLWRSTSSPSLKTWRPAIQVFELAAASIVRANLGGIGGHDGEGHTFLVDVQSDEVNDFAHGCLVPCHWLVVAAENIGLDQAGG